MSSSPLPTKPGSRCGRALQREEQEDPGRGLEQGLTSPQCLAAHQSPTRQESQDQSDRPRDTTGADPVPHGKHIPGANTLLLPRSLTERADIVEEEAGNMDVNKVIA